MKYLFIFASLFITFTTSAQTSAHSTVEKQQVYRYVEQMPQAGYDLNKYFTDNMRYSQTAIDNAEKRQSTCRLCNAGKRQCYKHHCQKLLPLP